MDIAHNCGGAQEEARVVADLPLYNACAGSRTAWTRRDGDGARVGVGSGSYLLRRDRGRARVRGRGHGQRRWQELLVARGVDQRRCLARSSRAVRSCLCCMGRWLRVVVSHLCASLVATDGSFRCAASHVATVPSCNVDRRAQRCKAASPRVQPPTKMFGGIVI